MVLDVLLCNWVIMRHPFLPCTLTWEAVLLLSWQRTLLPSSILLLLVVAAHKETNNDFTPTLENASLVTGWSTNAPICALASGSRGSLIVMPLNLSFHTRAKTPACFVFRCSACARIWILNTPRRTCTWQMLATCLGLALTWVMTLCFGNISSAFGLYVVHTQPLLSIEPQNMPYYRRLSLPKTPLATTAFATADVPIKTGFQHLANWPVSFGFSMWSSSQDHSIQSLCNSNLTTAAGMLSQFDWVV